MHKPIWAGFVLLLCTSAASADLRDLVASPYHHFIVKDNIVARMLPGKRVTRP